VDPQQLIANFKRLAGALTTRQIVTLAAAFAAVVGIVGGFAYWVSAPTYTLLYTDLDPESANAVITRLKNEKIPYVLGPGGRSIEVPSSRVDELRLDVEAQGLLTTGRIGFEVFDRTAFGTTEFLEHVNYQRGLEGELARTIGTIAEVASARVHLALAKESLFVRDAEQAKASVVLKLRNSHRPLAPSTVAGIAGLVAASVESLRPESVVIIDTFGRPLSKQQGDDRIGTQHVEWQQQLERGLTAKVVDLLEPIVGPGRVRVNVSARLDNRSQEETEERWDPTAVVRSRQSSIDQTAVNNAQGIAGARANAPPSTSTALPPAAAPAPMVAGRSTETTNYEIGKVTRHTIAPSGQLARLSVAVIIDDERTALDANGQRQATSTQRSAEAMERIRGLVAAAVGLDTARGDQLTVENIAFDEPAGEQETQLPWWRQLGPRYGIDVVQILKVGAVLLLAVLAYPFVLRPMVRMALPSAALPEVFTANGMPQGKTVAELESELDAAANSVRRLPALTKRLAQRADEQPEEMARLVRSWLTEGES
jgi:flagellar M-ring protein FliF